MTPELNSRKSRRKLVLLVAVTLIAFAPVLSVLTTSAIATALGCKVDEGNIHPCLIAGLDIGGMLYGMGVMGWLMIPAAPLMLVAILGWIALGVSAVIRRLPNG